MSQPDLSEIKFWFSSHDGRLSHYESEWSAYIGHFRQLSVEGATLGKFVDVFDRGLNEYRGVLDSGIAGELPRHNLGRFADLAPPLRLGVEQGRYVAVPDKRSGFEFLLPAIDRGLELGADCVVEFGSGLGTNLARLRLHYPGRKLTYIACEPTEAGRNAATTMFMSDPGMRAEVRAFDYALPDFGFLESFRRPIAFTSHSIEQVAVLGEQFYSKLLASNVATCVHLEPIGWQRYSNIFDIVVAMLSDQAMYSNVLRDYDWLIDDSRLADNSAMWSAYHVYNIDLLRLVSEALERGQINLFALAYDIGGLNPLNPSSLIAWTNRRHT